MSKSIILFVAYNIVTFVIAISLTVYLSHDLPFQVIFVIMIIYRACVLAN